MRQLGDLEPRGFRAAAGHLPSPLWKQLKPGGRMVIPVGRPSGVQRLILVRKTEDGRRQSVSLGQVRFVPLRRDRGRRDGG